MASRVESLQDLEAQLADELAAVDETWQQKAAEVETVDVRVKKSDVRVTALALLWIPIA